MTNLLLSYCYLRSLQFDDKVFELCSTVRATLTTEHQIQNTPLFRRVQDRISSKHFHISSFGMFCQAAVQSFVIHHKVEFIAKQPRVFCHEAVKLCPFFKRAAVFLLEHQRFQTLNDLQAISDNTSSTYNCR